LYSFQHIKEVGCTIFLTDFVLFEKHIFYTTIATNHSAQDENRVVIKINHLKKVVNLSLEARRLIWLNLRACFDVP
jgi:hypothetical protein